VIHGNSLRALVTFKRAQQVMKKGYLKLKFMNYIGIVVGLLVIASALFPLGGYHLEGAVGITRGVSGDFDLEGPRWLIALHYSGALTGLFASLLVMINGRTKSQNHPS